MRFGYNQGFFGNMVGGFLANLVPLASYAGDLLNVNGTRKIRNEGSARSQLDAVCYSGRAIELTGTAYVDIPLDHILGDRYAEDPLCSITGDENTCSYDSAEKKWSIHVETTTGHTYSPYVRYYADSDETANRIYKITVIVTCTRGSAYVNNLETGDANGNWNILPIRYAMSEGETKKWEYTSYFKPNSTPTQRSITVTFDGENYHDFDAEAELILEPITATGDILYFDVDQKKHIVQQIVNTHYRLENLTCNSITPLKIGKHFTEEDIAKLDKEPELLAQLALGDAGAGLSLRPEDVQHFFAAGEKSIDGYLDSYQQMLISDTLNTNGPQVEIAASKEYVDNADRGNFTWTKLDDYNAIAETDGSGNRNDLYWTNRWELTDDDFYYVTVAVEIISGENIVLPKYYFGGHGGKRILLREHIDSNRYIDHIIANRDYSRIDSYPFFIQYFDYTKAGKIKFTFSVPKKITVAEIKNYTQSIRDNADQLPCGLQLIKFKQNEIGALTEYVEDGMEFNGDRRYAKSPLILSAQPAPLSLEFVIKAPEYTGYAYSGIGAGDIEHWFCWGFAPDRQLFCRYGSRIVLIGEQHNKDDLVHVIVVFNGSTICTYHNGAKSMYSIDADTFNGTEGMLNIGGASSTVSLRSGQPLVRFYNKALADAEVARLYNEAKQKYPIHGIVEEIITYNGETVTHNGEIIWQ